MTFASKLLVRILRSSLLSSSRLAYPSLLSTPSVRIPGPLLSLRFCSAATADVDVAAAAATAVSSGSHPWPEWDRFLDKLRAKGYFERLGPVPSPSAVEGSADGEATAADNAVASADTYPFNDRNRVKNACLKFARDRYDLLGFLPKQHIQAIVQYGCPNFSRKPVNAAKRLRRFVQVQEKDAYGVCKIRGSCDKAYVTVAAEDEVEAMTVDVVHILLSYAIEPTSLSGEISVDEGVQESARKLLSELTARSDTEVDPSCIKPVSRTAGKSKESVAKKGDWLCPNCNFLNFWRNHRCLECKADGPRIIAGACIIPSSSDWICTQCHFMNFTRNKICFKCEEPRPKRQLNPGEWECPSCRYVNFRRNKICKKCNHDRPEDDTQDNNLGQRNIRGAGRNRTFNYIDRGKDDDYALQYKGNMNGRGPGRISARSRGFGFAGQEDGLLTSKSRRRAEEDEDDDVLPYEGERKHVVSRRATPAERRFTAARNH